MTDGFTHPTREKSRFAGGTRIWSRLAFGPKVRLGAVRGLRCGGDGWC
jgi:hypothetical protein